MAGRKRLRSAYEVAVSEGFVGTQSQWAATVEAGSLLASAKREANDTTTNMAVDNPTLMNNLIPGLSITLVGRGRPVEVRFQTQIYHTVANTAVSAILMVNGDGGSNRSQWMSNSSPATSASLGPRPLQFTREMMLAEDVEYVFEIAKQIGAAGTGTFVGAVFRPTILSAVQL